MDPITNQDLLNALRQEISEVLKVPSESVPLANSASLQERGVASMGALRIQFRLQEKFGVQISLTEILDARDLEPLAAQLHRQLTEADG